MSVKTYNANWSKNAGLKGAWYFFLHFVILVVIAAILLLYDKFANITEYMSVHGANYLYALFCTFLLTTITYFYFMFENKELISNGRSITLIFMVLDLYVVISYLLEQQINIYARPVAFVALMIFVLVGRREAIFLNIISALLMFIIDTFVSEGTAASNEYYSSLLISFSAGMIAIFFCDKAKTRFRVIAIGVAIVIPIDLIIFLLEISNLLKSGNALVGEMSTFEGIITRMGYGLFGGVMSAVFFLALLPIFENIFNCLTVFRLRELISSDAILLQKLKKESPGTYNHSMVVAQLAEASAAAIGENVDFARAAAMYHDVGKLDHPEYFTENQGEYNLHDELSPELSADMIREHAIIGHSMIKRNHLPDFLADVALQHHGTLPIRYFYAKALKMTDGELNIEDFSYVGPKPQTKVAAIIMIADASEAAVRATNSRKPEDAEKAIRNVIEERMNLDQFSECDITMNDLTKITHALVSALSGVNHHRVKYPKIQYRRNDDGTTTGNV